MALGEMYLGDMQHTSERFIVVNFLQIMISYVVWLMN